MAAIASACATIFIRQGLRGSDPYTGFWINLVVGVIGLWGGVLLTGGTGRPTITAVAFFVLAGLIGTVGGRLLRFVAIERVGASFAAALINVNPLVAALLAVVLLGERVTVPLMAGTVTIVLGTMVLSATGLRVGFRPRQLALPLLSATCFGVVAVLRKLGLSGASPMVGTAINVSAAMIAFTAFLLASGQRDVMRSRGRSLGYFVAAGVAENGAVLLMVIGLSLGAVNIVAPLYGTSPVFVLLLSFFFLKGETLTARVIAGTVLIVLGVYLITA